MSVEHLDDLNWRKSSFSQPQGDECVEVAFRSLGTSTVVRDTKDRDGGVLSVGGAAWSAFLSQVR